MTKMTKNPNTQNVQQLNAMTATDLPDSHTYRMGWISGGACAACAAICALYKLSSGL